MRLHFVLFFDTYQTKNYGRNTILDRLLILDDSAWYKKTIYNGRRKVITTMYLIQFWSAESGLCSRLCKSFSDCFYYEKNSFEKLEQNYVCALPKIKYSKYFGKTKAIYFQTRTDPLVNFHGLSNERIGFGSN